MHMRYIWNNTQTELEAEMKRFSLLLVVVLFAVSATSCVNIEKKMMAIESGMSKSELLELMGRPGNRQVTTDKNGNVLEAMQWKTNTKTRITVYVTNKTVKGMQTYEILTGESGFRTINWQEVPDYVIEQRVR